MSISVASMGQERVYLYIHKIMLTASLYVKAARSLPNILLINILGCSAVLKPAVQYLLKPGPGTYHQCNVRVARQDVMHNAVATGIVIVQESGHAMVSTGIQQKGLQNAIMFRWLRSLTCCTRSKHNVFRPCVLSLFHRVYITTKIYIKCWDSM